MPHPHMALDIDEVIALTTLKEKTTAIIPTGPAHINCLLWSVFSLLLRSQPHGLLEHFIVCIDGPDKRTGDPGLQNKKQAFLEELRRLRWYHDDKESGKDMPITVIRAWSRVGHAEVVEMGVPWIHTDSYTVMHDDVIITSPDWQEEVKSKFYNDLDKNLIAYGSKDLLFAHCDHTIACGLYLLRLPEMYSHFLVCNRKLMRKIGGNFGVFHLGSIQCPLQFDLSEEVEDLDGFYEYYNAQGLLQYPPQSNEVYNFARMGFGAWVYYQGTQAGLNFVPINHKNIAHFGSMSMPSDAERAVRLEAKQPFIDQLEEEIAAHPDYSLLYNKYKEEMQYD